MADKIVTQIACDPGIRRDGTDLDTNFYNDGLWVRFYRGKPRKMGGMKRSISDAKSSIRAIYPHYFNNTNFCTLFSTAGVERVEFNGSLDLVNQQDRTPITDFVANSDWQWQVDVIPDFSGGTGIKLCAHASRPGTSSDETAYPLYTGYLNDVGAVTKLAKPATAPTVSGGVVALGPYLFAYGSQGLIQNSIAGNPDTWTGGEANAANVASSKIMKGLSMRGSGQSPAGLFWSRESLIRVSFIGGTALWKYDTLTNQTSLISANAAIEYDGLFFWLGSDRFYMFNGQVQELPNQMNLNWFFTNLNWNYRHRIWAMKQPRWGEIWWFFPSGTSTECNKALIFNVREKCWYDAAVMRTAGTTSATLPYPILAKDDIAGAGTCEVYVHEFGTDLVQGASTTAIDSYFETADFGFVSGGLQNGPQGPDRWTRVVRVEPDFVQTGEMEMTVSGRNYANGTLVTSDPYAFTPGTTKIDTREMRRHVKLKFRSNVNTGFYEMGKVLLHLETGDVRG